MVNPSDYPRMASRALLTICFLAAAFDTSAAVMSEEALAEREHARQGHSGVDETALDMGGDGKVCDLKDAILEQCKAQGVPWLVKLSLQRQNPECLVS